jgi:manganese transport system permease protein
MDGMLEYAFNQRGLLAALIIGFVNGCFGGTIVLRRSSLFAGALSHTLFPGIAVGALIAGLNPMSALIGACLTATAVGLGAHGIAAASRLDRDAVLAVLFTAAFGGGLMILDRLPVYVSLDSYLFGNILGVSDADLWFSFGAGGLILSAMILFRRPLLVYLFSPEVAATQGVPVRAFEFGLAALLIVAMIASMQAVGVILTLGLLVAPPSIMLLYVDSPQQIFFGGGLIGAAVSTGAIFLSNWLNVQTGALIVALLGVLFLAAFALSPRYGLRARLRRHRPPRHE